ncbi:MAG TPA: hypothetical protein VKX31_02005 [Brumimicrobium sp.]|nr:hypothetical protein [Brumimicrobium sp.]
MRTFVIIITVFGIVFTSSGQQKKLSKADAYFNEMAYALAIDLYVDLKGSSVDTPEMRRKLGDSYYQIGRYQKAVEAYSSMVESSEATKEDYFRYAKVLKMMGDYELSDYWMKKFSEQSLGDIRAELFLEKQNYKEVIEGVDPFFELQSVDFNTSNSDFGGYINPKENRVYFLSSKRGAQFIKHRSSRDENSFLDVYKANTNAARELGNVSKVGGVNTKYHEGPLAFSPDGLQVYFTRSSEGKDKDGLQRLKIFISDVDENGDFYNEKEFPYNSDDYSIGHPSISKDGKTLYLVSDKPGGFGGADIYKMEILGDNEYGEMINLGEEINTEGQEVFPFIDAENRLFFSSDGHPGLGGLDVYIVFFRGSAVAKVGNLGKPINSQFDDFSFALTKDLKSGFVSSNREGGKGGDDVYQIKKLRPIVFGTYVKGKCRDENQIPIVHALVELRSETNRLIESTFTDENGEYSFVVEFDQNYKIRGAKQFYQRATDTLSTFAQQNSVEVNLLLEKDTELSIHGIVTNSETGEAIKGVEVRIVDEVKGEELLFSTAENGGFTYLVSETMLNDLGRYKISLSKQGYQSKSVQYDVKFEEVGQYIIHSSLNLSLEPMPGR